jgi:hypothetical protein
VKRLLSTSAILCVIALLVAATPVHACDCLLSKNWSNPACKGKVPKLPNGSSVSSTTTNTLSQGQTQGQGQTQSASATGGTSNATGGKVSNSGNSTNANQSSSKVSVSAGPVSAAGGSGGQATGGASTAEGGSVGNTSSTSNSSNQGNSRSSAAGGSSTSEGSSDSQTSVYAAPRIPVGTAVASIGITTAGCRFAEGLGVQTMPAGTSLGFSFKDHDCARFQLAQFLYSRGQDIAGDKVLCQITELKDALGADCLADVHQIVATAAVYPAGERERREARAQWDSVQK